MTLLFSNAGSVADEKVAKSPISPAFLEFLASLEEVDGQLVSPMDMDALPESESQATLQPIKDESKPAQKRPSKNDAKTKEGRQ